ncbi:MAG: hypothetical protein HY906_25560, partial [Deltaproteobacteria bacterium]|nr:hypothetical protein [Deltaproteobacteria bacterium]
MKPRTRIGTLVAALWLFAPLAALAQQPGEGPTAPPAVSPGPPPRRPVKGVVPRDSAGLPGARQPGMPAPGGAR